MVRPFLFLQKKYLYESYAEEYNNLGRGGILRKEKLLFGRRKQNRKKKKRK